jgi:hypothetical protein
MFNRIIVQKALKRIRAMEGNADRKPGYSAEDQSSEISLLIHNIFGGEILKTRNKKGWHFYNRINGERIDFAMKIKSDSDLSEKFEDIPSTPAETSGYFDFTDYLTLLLRFVSAFEEAVGLGKYRQAGSA